MRLRETFFLLLIVATAGIASAARAADAATPQVEFTATGVIARNVTPGAQVVFFGVAGIPVPERYFRRITRWHKAVSDDDRDGMVTLDLGQPLPQDSVWLVCEVTNNHYTIARPQGAKQRAPLARAATIVHKEGGSDAFVSSGRAFDLLYLEPGRGAWSWVDVTRPPAGAPPASGLAGAALEDAKPLTGAALPTSFQPGGLLVAIDDLTLAVQVSRVTGSGDLQ